MQLPSTTAGKALWLLAGPDFLARLRRAQPHERAVDASLELQLVSGNRISCAV
jgi:hypothetical protein